MQMKDAITWFEIPAQDLDRAARFYETVLGVDTEGNKVGLHALA